MPSPFKLVDERGVTITLTKASPALVKSLLQAAWQRTIERRLAVKLGADCSGRRLCVGPIQQA
eukprot:12027060-Alexandrium_andersonii.AAC.1